MKRRTFLQSAIALVLAPAVGAVTVEDLPSNDGPIIGRVNDPGRSFRDIDDMLNNYNFAEWRAAKITAIAEAMDIPEHLLLADLTE